MNSAFSQLCLVSKHSLGKIEDIKIFTKIDDLKYGNNCFSSFWGKNKQILKRR